MKKQTKIVATIGPASGTKKILEKLVAEGVNVCRLNFSHGTHNSHLKLIKDIRAVSKKTNESLAVLQDLQGPRVRVGNIGKNIIKVKQGEKISFCCNAKAKGCLPISYKNLCNDLKNGDRLLLNNGLLEMKVLQIKSKEILTTALTAGEIWTHSGINLPDTILSIPALTDKDKKDVEFGVKNGVDFIALSFVTTPKDIFDLRYLIDEFEKKHKISLAVPIKIIAKIEKHEALQNIDAIIDAADGIMVARGDLGIEIPTEDVPIAQKSIIEKCLDKAKPVIVATQMLESMIINPKPTRAEVSDIANAVLDNTDAVMLSGETATGKYPVETVSYMSRIISRAEKSVYDDYNYEDHNKLEDVSEAIGKLSNILAESVDAKMIVATSLSGNTGRNVSRFRPHLPIYVATDKEEVARQLNLFWGVTPFVIPICNDFEELVKHALDYLKKNSLVKKGDKVIIVAGEPVGRSGNVNLVEVREAS